MTSTNDGKEVKSNQTSGTKSKTYLIELYKSLEARLSEAGDASERTEHLCDAWRSVHSLCQHSAPSTHTHLLNWLQRHTARAVLQTSWQKPEREDDRKRLEEAINAFTSEAAASVHGGRAPWEVALKARGDWFKRVLGSPWDHPVLASLLNPSGAPPTDDEVLTWLKEERGVTFVVRLHTLVGEKCDDIAASLATAVMDRVRAGLPPVVDSDEQEPPQVEQSGPSFGDKLKDEAGFTTDVWESITDIEFVLLHKRDSKRCIALAKQTPLLEAYPLIERLQKRLEASPQEKRLWKNAKEVAILIAQVVIARCMMVKSCQGAARSALYCCARLLAGLLAGRLAGAADALAAQAPTARHLHTMAAAVDKQLSHSQEDMKPYVCELYVRAITAGMNELERLKLKTEKETEARSMETCLASWFVQLGTVLSRSDRIACECTLTAFSLHPSQKMYERIEAAPPLAPVVTDSNDPKEETVTSEFGSWANDSRSQTNLVKTSETLNLKQTQNQANVLSTAIFNEGEALGLSPTLCQDIAVLLAGPRVKTLSWDMDRTLLLENCRAYSEMTHGGTKVLTRELKYLNIDPKHYQHLPEEKDDDENDPYYGIERGYEHLAVLEEPEDIWADVDADKTESASSIEDDYLAPRRKKKTKRIRIDTSSGEDSDPLSLVAEAKRTQKKKERPHSKERSKERSKKKQYPVDPLDPDVETKEKPRKEKKERKMKEKIPKVIGGKRNSFASLIGVAKTKKKHKDFLTIVTTPVTDSDYDSQGKNSLTSLNSEGNEHDTLEESLRSNEQKSQECLNEKKRSTFALYTSKMPQTRPPYLSKMQYRPQNPSGSQRQQSPSLVRPSTPDRNKTMFSNYKHYPEDVRANLSRLLEYRRQKEEKAVQQKLAAQTNVRMPPRTPAILRPDIPPLQANISPKSVTIPEIPKSYISKEQVEQFAELMRANKAKESVIHYAKKTASKTALSTSDSSCKTQQSNGSSLKMTDIVNTSYDRLMAEIAERHSKTQEVKPPLAQYQPSPPMPVQRSYNALTPGQRDFQNFLQNYEQRKNLMPSHPIDMSSRAKRPMPVSRVVPVVPNAPKVEPKPVQCAKQHVQLKKPEATLNTFSRLSYMHKNKQNEIKNKVQKPTCSASTYQEVSSELDEIIKEHQRAQRKVIQAKRESEIAQESAKKVDSTAHPLLSNLLSNTTSSNQYKSDQLQQTLSTKTKLQQAVPNKNVSVQVPLATLNTSLSEKDQNDLWNLLRQQNKLNNIAQYSTNFHSKPSTSTITKADYDSAVGQKQQHHYQCSKIPNPEERSAKDSLESKIINVLSNTLLKPGIHAVSKGISVNVKPSSTNTTEKVVNTVCTYDKVKKNTPSKVHVEKIPESEKPEWQTVMHDILKLKTPSRGEPNALDVALKKSSFEKCLKQPTYQPKLDTDTTSRKHQENDDRLKPVITSIQNVVYTKKGVKLQDAPRLQRDSQSKTLSKQPAATLFEKSKKLNTSETKKLPQESHRKQFTYSGPKHDDPFISGIPNSDYDLLEELMDDDLRKEIGELSSDDESYNSAAQSFLKPSKNNENKRVSVQYNKCLDEASPPKPGTNVSCQNSRQSANETSTVTVKPVTQCANKITPISQENNQQQKAAFSVESILATQHAPNHISTASSNENQACNSVRNLPKNQVLMNSNNIYISAVPQQAPLQNVVVVGSEIVYGGYSSVQTPIQTMSKMTANAYVAINNSPTVTLYQTTQYTAPVVIGASVTMPVTNNVSYSSVSVERTVNNNMTQTTYSALNVEPQTSIAGTEINKNISDLTETTLDNLNRVTDYPEQNYDSQDEIKGNERKVLSEVQDFAMTEKVDNTRNQIVTKDNSETIKKDGADDKERLKKKRLAILNREIYHRCGEKTIPLSYSPLLKTENIIKHDISKAMSGSYSASYPKEDKLAELTETEDEKLLAQIKNNLQDLSNAINEVSSPATPDSTESKENKSIPQVPCRRVLLRSSNKLMSKPNVKVERVVSEMPSKKPKAKTKVDISETPAKILEKIKAQEAPAKAQETKDEVVIGEIKPIRVSKRIRNKKIAMAIEENILLKDQNTKQSIDLPNNKDIINSRDKFETPSTEYLDIETELQRSIIAKSKVAINISPTKEREDINPVAYMHETSYSLENAGHNDKNNQMTSELADKTIQDQNIVPEYMNDMQIDEECVRRSIILTKMDYNVSEQTMNEEPKDICATKPIIDNETNDKAKNIAVQIFQTKNIVNTAEQLPNKKIDDKIKNTVHFADQTTDAINYNDNETRNLSDCLNQFTMKESYDKDKNLQIAPTNQNVRDKICELIYKNESRASDIDKDISSDCLKASKSMSEVPENNKAVTENEFEISSQTNDSAVNHAVSVSVTKSNQVTINKDTEKSIELIRSTKKTINKDNEKSEESNNFLKKMTVPAESKGLLLEKDEIDLDMSVTCEEVSVPKPSPTTENIITARSKPINSEKRKISEIRSKSIDIQKKNDEDNVSNDVVINVGDVLSKKIKENEISATSEYKTETSYKEPFIDNVSAELTPNKLLACPYPKALNTTKSQETSTETSTIANDDDDVVIIDNDVNDWPEVPIINLNYPVIKQVNIQTSFNKNDGPTPVNIEPTGKKDNKEKVFDVTPVNLKKGTRSKKAAALDDHSEIPLDFKDKIHIEQLPCTEPNTKKIRVWLPNGKKFRATVHGVVNVTYEKLFTFPSIKAALLNGLNCKKLIATVDVNNPDQILSAELLNVSGASTAIQKSEVETIDLLSDEEESVPLRNQSKSIHIEEKEFVFETELGKFTIPPMDKDLFIKHQKQLKQKTQILLKRVDAKPEALKTLQNIDKSTSSPSVQADKTPSIHKNLDINSVQTTQKVIPKIDISGPSKDITSLIPDQYVTGLINDIENKLASEVKNTPKIIPEVVEINDSSNDSVNRNQSVDTEQEEIIIDQLKNVLLKELGVEFSKKTAEKTMQKIPSSIDDDVKIIEKTNQVKVVKKNHPAKKRNRRKVLKLSTLSAGKSCRFSDLDEEDQQKIKRRKCAIKLIRCDKLFRIHEKEIVDGENKYTIHTPVAEDEPVIVTDEFSIFNTFDEKIDEERSSSPVIELSNVLVSLDTKSSEQEYSVQVTPLSCQAFWLFTKSNLHDQSMNNLVVTQTFEHSKEIRKGRMMTLSCEAIWLSTKLTTHSLSLDNFLKYANEDQDMHDDISKNTTPLTCEANWLSAKSTLHLEEENKKSGILLSSVLESDQEMCEYKNETMPLACAANWLTDKSALRLQIVDNKTILTDCHVVDNGKEICDDSMPVSLSCEADWVITKTTLHTQAVNILYFVQSNVHEFDNENNDNPMTKETIPLNCEANWLITKPTLHLRKVENAFQYEVFDDAVHEACSLSCDAHWFATKAALHLQRVDSFRKINVNKSCEIYEVTPLSCEARWFATKSIIHSEASNNELSACSNDFNSTILPQSYCVSSLVSIALELLQDANVIHQYGISLKRRLSVKTPAVRKIRKLNNDSPESNFMDCTLDTTASDVTDVSDSILDDMKVTSGVEISTEDFIATPKITICGTKYDDSQNINAPTCYKEKTSLSPILRLQLDNFEEIHIDNSSESHSSSSVLDTSDLLRDENYIPTPIIGSLLRTEKSYNQSNELTLQSDKSEDINDIDIAKLEAKNLACTAPETGVSIKNQKEIMNSNENLTNNCDSIEANLAQTFVEKLIDINKSSENNSLVEDIDSKESNIELCSDKKSDGITDDNITEKEVLSNDIEEETCSGDDHINHSIVKIDHEYFSSLTSFMQPMYIKEDDHVVIYVPTESVELLSNDESIKDLEEEIVDMRSDEILDDFVFTSSTTRDSWYTNQVYEEHHGELAIEKSSQTDKESIVTDKVEPNIGNTSKTDDVNKYADRRNCRTDRPTPTKEGHNGHDYIEVKLAEILGEPLTNRNLEQTKKNSSRSEISRSLLDVEDVASQLGEICNQDLSTKKYISKRESKDNQCMSNARKKRKSESYEKSEVVLNLEDTESMEVKVPKRTYAKGTEPIVTRRRSLKRKMDMSDTKTSEKKYRKGKNIDYPKFTAAALSETVYTKEYKRLIDYYSTVKFSYTFPFNKEHIDVHGQLKSWPILDTHSATTETQAETNGELFAEIEKSEALLDPLKQTLIEEISCKFDENSYTPSNIPETNFNMGFGERSGRVIQESKDGEYTILSAATLSDVKQLQPLLPSDEKEIRVQDILDNNLDQKLKAKRFVDNLNLREKVRSFFEKSRAELDLDWEQNQKKTNLENDQDIYSWPFGYLTSTCCFRPSPVDVTVNVVQVGQLPVSAAAQNPVTCDPRVTHVSNASPQCSPENSIGDELQTPIKTEYTELTTADITLPLMQEYVTQHHSMSSESQEPTNVYSANNSVTVPSDMKSIVKIELMEETSQDHEDDNVNYENNGLQQLPNGHINSNVQYQYENATNNMMAEPSSNAQPATNSLAVPKTAETFSENKSSSDAVEKSDQLAHAMNAAGISATKGPTKSNNIDTMPQNHQPNVTISQANANNFPKTSPINAISLQQALAQILPPSLNQANTSENNPQTSTNPQVLHIVQGSNSQSVINKPNGTQLLHIVQNKSTANSNGTPATQQNTFSGLSLVDGALQQGGNQLLHIVNAANQKNANAGQLLKRVNLLTNLANVQGSNEQKMVQFVCKSADGKSIQLPHQRSMVLRLQPLDPTTVPTTAKQNDNQDHASSSGTSHSVSEKESNPQEIKSRSLYEENYAKFVQNDAKFAQNGDQKSVPEKSTSLPKFNQVFGKQVYQEKQDELETENMPQNPDPPEENNPPLEQINDMNSQMIARKPSQPQSSHVQSNLVQQIKQTIGPMNIQTMHGGVIYTRQIPVNIGNGQTINLITVPSTELVDDSAQKQQTDAKFGNQEGDPPIIKIVPTNQPATANGSAEENNGQLKTNNEGNPQTNAQPQPQPVLTQMRIKLPMLSKAPQMVGGTRVVRPSFFQIQRNVIGGANQQVYQQLVLTAAPPIGQSIRLPAQVQKPKIPSETQSSPESQMSSSTLEQLREFDMVLEQVKERSTVQPGSSTSTNNFSKLKGSPDTTDAPTPSTSTQESPTQVLYSVGNSQPLNMVNYVTRKSTITSTTTSSFVRSPDSTGTVESPSSSTHSHLPHTVTSDSCASSSCASEAAAATTSQPKPKKKKPKPSTSNSNPFNIKNTPKPSSQKPLEDEQTTQRILYILAEYKEQVENSPDKDKPAPRRRNNPAAPNAGSSKRKKSSSGSRRRDMSPVLGEDSCRTMGSEDSSCGTSLGECNECLETHSPEESPKKVVRRLTFEQETQITQTRTTTTTTTVPQRNVIVTDGQAFAVRGATGKPATTVLMPANYLLPVSMVKGGQQIAIVTNRGPKLLVGAGEGGTGGTLLFQRLIGPGGLKPVLARPGVRHIRLPTAALHNLQTFNIATPTSATVQPPDSTASPAPAPTPPDLVDTRAMSSPWPDRDAGEVKPERGNSSPEGSEPWNLPSSSIADDYGYEEIVRTDNMDRTVLDAIPDRYSPDLEAQRIFDKMFDSDSKKSMYDSRCVYDIDASDDDKAYHQVVHRKDGRHTTRLTHVSAAALRHKYAILEHELRLQKSLSEECEDLGVDSPSASELFPEAELLFAPSPAHEQTIDQCHTPQPTIHTQGIPQPDLDDQIATDQLLTHKERHDDLDINLDDVGEIVTVGEDGMTTIPLDHEEFARSHEEFARSHPNTTFHSEPEDGEVPPFTIAQGVKGRQITFHARGVPGTVVMAPQTTVISQATVEAAGSQSTVKFSDIDNMINAMPSPQHAHNLNMPSVLVKDGNESLTKFDRLLNESQDMPSNPASVVHSTGNGTQVIRRVQYENRRDSRYLVEDSHAMIGGDTKMTDERRDLHSMDDTSSSERHPELFWDQSRSERKRFDFSSDSDKCCKSPYDEVNSDSSGLGAHTRLDSVIKAARPERRRSDGSSAEESHPPLRTYPAKRTHQHGHHSHHHADVDRSLTGKTRAPDRCHDVKDESRRRASNRGVVKRGCHCCNGSSAAPKPKKSRPKKSNEYPHN